MNKAERTAALPKRHDDRHAPIRVLDVGPVDLPSLVAIQSGLLDLDGSLDTHLL